MRQTPTKSPPPYVLKMSLDEIKLIETVRDYECIYNNTINEYKNTLTKKAAWAEIASKLKRSVSDCKIKWTQLRNAFLHALNRRKSSSYLNKWKFEDEMSFLLPFMGYGTNDTVSSNEINDQNDDSSGTQNANEHSNTEHTPDRKKRKRDYQKDFIEVLIEENRPCVRVEDGVINKLPKTRTPNKSSLKCKEGTSEAEIQPVLLVEDEDSLFHTIHATQTMPPRCNEVNTGDENNESIEEKITPSCQKDAKKREINMFYTTKKQKVDLHEKMFHLIKERLRKKEVHKDEIDLLFESLAKAVKQLPKTQQFKVKLDVTKLVYEAQMRCESQKMDDSLATN